MPKYFVKNEQINQNQIDILGQDVNHIKNVLRMRIGDTLELCNCDTQENYNCEIVNIEKEKIQCEILEKIEQKVESNVEVTIFQGLPKGDKMEYIIQKSVELGVYDITPVEMKRCVVKLNEKDKIKKIERWQKISEGAAKQCGRNIIPTINNVVNVKNICNQIPNYDIVLVAYEKENKNTLKNELKNLKNMVKETKQEKIKIAVVIGPEGGLEEQDVKMLKENNAKVITLGKRILRTETVALNTLSIIMYELEA